MPLKGVKKKSYNKKNYEENKDKIAEKKAKYEEEVEKSRTDNVAQSRESWLPEEPREVSC